MYKKANPLFLICQTPLHTGSGSELGIVDLPIQRERHTGFPKIESSSLKGAIREAMERKIYNEPATNRTFTSLNANDTKIHRVFGYDDGSLDPNEKDRLKNCFQKKDKDNEYEIEFSGAVGFTDARLLLFPVKSMKGVFAWITCPKVLKQFAEDMKLAGKVPDKLEEMLKLPLNQYQCISTDKSNLIVNGMKGKSVILEEYTFRVSQEIQVLSDFGKWLKSNILLSENNVWAEKLTTDIILLPNDDFKDFVNLSTEVITRTKIDNATGTVESGALFTEEYLPAESVMYSLVLTADEFKAKDAMNETDVRKFFHDNLPEVFQIGGNATLGKGLVNAKFGVANNGK